MSDDRDWRLEVELRGEDRHRVLEDLRRRARSAELVKEIGAAVSDDVVITHDGNVLFAYAGTRAGLASARAAIEALLHKDGIGASVTVTRWDDRVDEWVQLDPPLTGAARRAEEAHRRDEERRESRTLVATVGRLIRSEVEQTMQGGAERLGLTCEIHDHPHLLDTQVAFTVTGSRRKIDEFAEDLRQEEIATMRTQREVLLSPL